jgi:heparan-sulfate lyase
MLYKALMQGAEIFDEPKWRAQAKLELDQLPRQTSFAWREAGLYMMRNEWGPQQVMFAFHDSPPAVSGHDQEDNGTFELYAYGRWLMTDSGYYTYGHDAAGRAWHRQTSVHQTLTLNGANNKTLATHRLWVSAPDWDAVCVDNAAYPGLMHRRTVWFPGRRFIVILDEAIGEAKGQVDLHYQFAPGEFKLDPATKSACTCFPDANVFVCLNPAVSVILEEEEGWTGWDYNKRVKRPAFRFRCKSDCTPAAFVTLLVPYRGVEPPRVARACLPADYAPSCGSAEISVTLDGQHWLVGYDLVAKRAWCKAK